MRKVHFIINPSEITAGTRGASLGPAAIMTAARKQGSTIFSQYPKSSIIDHNDLLDQPTPYPYAKRIDGLLDIFKDLNEKVSGALKNGEFPFVLAGDHGSAAGTIAGIKNAYPDKKLGVIWIDAHKDLHTPYTTPSGNIHGMPLAIALSEDNLECKINDVRPESIEKWEELKNVGFNGAKFNPQDLYFIAVRDTEEQEDKLTDRLKIKNYTVAEVRESGVSKVVKEIQEKLSHCDMIYVSFDVDSMDPDQTSYGTGTPVSNGLSIDEAQEILAMFAEYPKTVCIEFVEVNPCLDDKKNRMAEVAFSLMVNTIEALN
ncbi:MAG: arginase [Bacteroidetes bacterium]|nr:MAG: arginase [Bacteroidota bacterium]